MFIAASYSQHIIGDRIDEQSNISKDSTAHTYGDCKEDVKEIVNCLQKLKLLKFKADRLYGTFPKISKSPLDQLDPILLDQWLTKHKRKLAAGLCINDESDNKDEDDDGNEVTSNDSDDDQDI